MSSVLAFIISFILITAGTPFLISRLKNKGLGQKVRKDGPAEHLKKEGVPTAGGLLFSLVLFLVALLQGETSPLLVWTVFAVICFSLLGFSDDYIKLQGNRSLGLKARHKIFLMVLFSSLVGFYIYLYLPEAARLLVPFTSKEIHLDWLVVPFVIAVYLATANAVNLTDGLDGLAAGTCALAFLGFAVISFMLGNPTGTYLAATGLGLCLGFLWFNCYPADIIMGDTGSLALGAFLASIAVFQGLALFLLLVGGVFVLVTLSVIIQVIYFRLTGGKRILRMSPLHHHFELSGWAEPRIVIRFWIAGVLFLCFGIWGIM